MVRSEREEAMCSLCGGKSCLKMVLSVVLLSLLATAGLAAQEAEAGHYKMISTVEYKGKGQFRNRAETFIYRQTRGFAGRQGAVFVYWKRRRSRFQPRVFFENVRFHSRQNDSTGFRSQSRHGFLGESL